MNRRLLAGLAVVLGASGCVAWLPAAVPMRTVDYRLAEGKARCALVLLPGRGDDAETFAEHGFVEALRARRLSVDLVAADATMGYYFKGLLNERLVADVFSKVKARGYEKTWLLGISMGGMGSLISAERNPGVADGLILLAPFLGDDALVNEISAAGGLAKWQPGPVEPRFDADTYQRHVWAWLKGATAAGAPVIYLGYGTEDAQMSAKAKVLGAALPAGHVASAPGGHDWPPWNKLWGDWLDRSSFATDCAP
jgi:pimeloyl-ACP methyl ester carboxylesterase